MATNFPSTADTSAIVGGESKPAPGTELSDSTKLHPTHSDLHENVGDAVLAIEAKLGHGGSPTPAANTVLTGTVSGESAWATVDTAMISADAVTGAKIADDTINSEHYAAGSIDTEHIADDQVTQAKIAAGAVGTTELAADAVNGDKIADDAIAPEHLATDSVTADAIAAGAVDTAELAASAVETAKINDSAVTTAKINNSAVTTAKINDDAVTSAKMAATVAVDTAFSVGTLTASRALSTNSANAVDFYRSTATPTEGIILGRSDVGSTGANKFIVYANGDVATSTASYGGISDVRLKDVLGPSGDRLAQINDMEVIKYRLTKTTDDEGNIVDLDVPSEDLLGFSAQQLQTVAPGLVAEDGHGILNVKVSVLIPMLVKAVQELTARLEAVEG